MILIKNNKKKWFESNGYRFKDVETNLGVGGSLEIKKGLYNENTGELIVLCLSGYGEKIINFIFENRIINTTIEKVRCKKQYKGFSIKKNRFMLWNIEGGEIKTIK